MIEVEGKFILTPETKSRLLDGATFVDTKEFVVEFWDTKDWQLGLRNYALKKKNGKFELKASTANTNGSSSYSSIMRELTDDKDIYEALAITPKLTLEEDLRNLGYFPAATIHNIRNTYHKEDFILDFDEADFPLLKDGSTFHHAITEIELQVEDEIDVATAHEKLGVFAQKHGLTLANTRGKHLEFIYQNYPEHYQNLVKIGVIDK